MGASAENTFYVGQFVGFVFLHAGSWRVLMHYYFEVLKKYAVFSGRARRAEYWYYALFNFIAMVILFIVGVLAFGSNSANATVFYDVYILVTFLPSVAVTVRRLHDTDRSGWWWLIIFVPLIGGIVMLIFMCTDGAPDENRFGPPPKTYDYSIATA